MVPKQLDITWHLPQNLTKWIIYINVKCKIRKLLEKNIGENLSDLELDKDFLEMTPKI